MTRIHEVKIDRHLWLHAHYEIIEGQEATYDDPPLASYVEITSVMLVQKERDSYVIISITTCDEDYLEWNLPRLVKEIEKEHNINQ